MSKECATKLPRTVRRQRLADFGGLTPLGREEFRQHPATSVEAPWPETMSESLDRERCGGYSESLKRTNEPREGGR